MAPAERVGRITGNADDGTVFMRDRQAANGLTEIAGTVMRLHWCIDRVDHVGNELLRARKVQKRLLSVKNQTKTGITGNSPDLF